MLRFDARWYLQRYPDIAHFVERAGGSAEKHYHQYGALEGRSPNSAFDEEWYRRTYEDVSRAIAEGLVRSGFHHYLLHGAREGRNPHAGFVEQRYLKDNPVAANAVRAGLVRCGYEHFLASLAELESPISELPSGPPPFVAYPVHTPHIDHLKLVIAPELARSPRLNLVLPSLELKHMSGGPNTALNLLYSVAQLGEPVRFLTSQTSVEANQDELWEHIFAVVGCRDQLGIELGEAHPGALGYPIGENDVFVATSWWTAQMIAEVLERMRTRRFFYLIQDYEPAMSPWSSEYCLGLETYSMDIIPVFNTSVLRDYFVAHGIGRFADQDFAQSALAFEPAVDRAHFYAEPRAPGRANRLLFYARPIKAARNLFAIGLSALKRCADDGVFDRSEWELNYIGDHIATTPLSRSITIKPRPWLSYAGYAQLMRQSDILLSLMLSPHPSYPPLEMSASGGLVVTNTFDCKTSERLKQYSAAIMAAPPRLQDIADTLRHAVQRVEDEGPEPVHCTLPGDWQASFATVAREIQTRWHQLVNGARILT